MEIANGGMKIKNNEQKEGKCKQKSENKIH